MRVLAACVVAFGLIASPAMAGANGAGANAEPATPAGSDSSAKANPPAAAKPDNSTTESDLQQLKDLIEAQSKQLADQAKQLKEQQQEMQTLEQQFKGGSDSSSSSSALTAAPVTAAVIAPAAGVGGAAAAFTTPSAPAVAPQGNNDQPAAIRYKGITLTPGGFAAAETVWRQKAMGSDINTPFNSVPFSGASQAHISEFNASGRQSRISMLVQGKLANVTIGSFYEADFLSAGATSNNNQSNSYSFRQRQFWGQAAFNNGFTFTGGQMWSLLTETANGMDNRSENLPQTIDAQYNVGFSWARQYGLRVVKELQQQGVAGRFG